MGKIHCTEWVTELEDTVKFCSSSGTALSDENNATKPNIAVRHSEFSFLCIIACLFESLLETL